ncbi:unnamed protein product [Paramecium sonneborni]|uniref:Uncharacterized protein n=1 Tax=Paramecium sonneborni TaxID=65129 RepID=A0A8S1RHX6_9CILI|nr:unnamed protein product [Paramecium sonneborni]
MDDDIFLGLETVQQFDEKMKQFSQQHQFRRQLQRYPVQKILKRSNSFAQSQISTAINSSAHASRKQTISQLEINAPKRRHCEFYNDEFCMNLFAEKIEYLCSQCFDKNEIVIKELNRVAQELGYQYNNQEYHQIEFNNLKQYKKENTIYQISYKIKYLIHLGNGSKGLIKETYKGERVIIQQLLLIVKIKCWIYLIGLRQIRNLDN